MSRRKGSWKRTKHHKTDTIRHFWKWKQSLDNGITRLDITSGADTKKNLKTIDTRRRSCYGNPGCSRSDFRPGYRLSLKAFQVPTEENPADEYQDTATDIPRLIITKFRHQRSVEQYRWAYQTNKWKEPNRSLQGRITTSDLKVQRNVIDGDECSAVISCCQYEKKDSFFVVEKVDRKHSTLISSEDGENLLKTEHDG